MTGPAAGEPDPGRVASPRTGSRDGAAGVLGLLVAGLAFRLIIAYLLPSSGFGVVSFRTLACLTSFPSLSASANSVSSPTVE